MRRMAAQVTSLLALSSILLAGWLLLGDYAPAPGPPAEVAPVAIVGATGTLPLPPDDPRLPETRELATPTPVSTPAATAAPAGTQDLHIVIARLSIDLPLQVGDTQRDVPRQGFAGATPENVAFIYPGSRDVGAGGNTYIYAHARVGMFLNLWYAHLGDIVVIRRDDGSVVRSYEIGLIVPRVDSSDVQWLDPNGRERLTLQTSTGPRPEDPRFIVVAYPK